MGRSGQCPCTFTETFSVVCRRCVLGHVVDLGLVLCNVCFLPCQPVTAKPISSLEPETDQEQTRTQEQTRCQVRTQNNAARTLSCPLRVIRSTRSRTIILKNSSSDLLLQMTEPHTEGEHWVAQEGPYSAGVWPDPGEQIVHCANSYSSRPACGLCALQSASRHLYAQLQQLQWETRGAAMHSGCQLSSSPPPPSCLQRPVM